MPEADANPDLNTVKDDRILDLLLHEHSMLQDKIDKIGGFRFTIKGWALTLNTGTLVAAFATSLNRTMGILLVSVLVLLLWLLERRQAKLTELFQRRTLRIETRIMRRLGSLGVRRAEFATLICCPGIANELRTPIGPHRPDSAATSPLRRRRGLLRRIKTSDLLRRFRRSKLLHSLIVYDVWFYALLLGISVAAFMAFQQSHTAPNPKGHADGHAFKLRPTAEHS